MATRKRTGQAGLTVVENGQGQETTSREGGEGNEPQAAPGPGKEKAGYSLGAYQLTYHKPVLTLPDGTEVKCPHSANWGHESQKAALACIRKVAREHGVELAG